MSTTSFEQTTNFKARLNGSSANNRTQILGDQRKYVASDLQKHHIGSCEISREGLGVIFSTILRCVLMSFESIRKMACEINAKINDSAKIYLVGCIPLFVSVLFVDYGLFGVVLSVFTGVIALLVFSIGACIFTGMIFPRSIIDSKAFRISIFAIGCIAGVVFFHRTNRFYGSKWVAFETATGSYPYWNISVHDFSESDFLGLIMDMKYSSTPEYNHYILDRGGFIRLDSLHDGAQFSNCFEKATIHSNTRLCFDEKFEIGRIHHNAY